MKTVKDIIIAKSRESHLPIMLEEAIQRIEVEEENRKEMPDPAMQTVAIACDTIIQSNDHWHHDYKIVLFRISDILNLPEPRAISDYENKCLYELLISDNIKQLSRADLVMTELQLLDFRNALELFFDEDMKARNLLTSVIHLHLPTPVANASARDHLFAYALGPNKDSLIKGVARHLYEGTQLVDTIFDEQKELSEYEDDWLESFYHGVKRAYGCDYTDSKEKLLRAKEDMASTADLYNTLTLYRILKDIKQDLVHACYYAKEFPEITSLMNLFA